MRLSPSISLAIVVAVALAAPVAAQEQAIHVGFGASSFDLSGTGSTFVGTLRYTRTVTGPLFVEVGTAFFNYTNQFGGEQTYLFPEVSVALKVPRGPLRPYLATGGGFTVALKGDAGFRPTLHVGAGVDWLLSRAFGLRVDFRLRSIDPFAGNTSDVTAGPLFSF